MGRPPNGARRIQPRRRLLEDSGQKGRHLWLFLERPVPAHVARGFGQALVRAHCPTDERLHLEVFPKQDRLDRKGLGNLVKLPLACIA